jgi:hypothetical protein
MRPARYGLIAILLSIVVLPLSARAVPLDDLLATTITQGDALFFSNFSASLFVFNNGRPSDLSEIDVSGITVNGEHGLRVGPGFTGPSFGGDFGGVHLLLGFDVTVTDTRHPIHGITLVVPFFVTGISSGVIFSAGPAGVSVFGPPRGGEPSEGVLRDVRTFSSDVASIHIDTFLDVGSLGCVADGGPLDVTFSQRVAEPSIVLLLVSSASVIAAMAHKIRQA